MTPFEFFSRLRAHLKDVVWSGTSNKIFGNNVFVVPELPIQQLPTFSSPCCFVTDQGAVNYGHHDQLYTQNFSIAVFVENTGDRYGEAVLLSGNRTVNTSVGAGLLEIEENLINDLRQVEELSSAKIVLKSKSKVKTQFVKKNTPLSFRSLAFSAFVSIDDVESDSADILKMPGFLYAGATNIPGGSFGSKLSIVTGKRQW